MTKILVLKPFEVINYFKDHDSLRVTANQLVEFIVPTKIVKRTTKIICLNTLERIRYIFNIFLAIFAKSISFKADSTCLYEPNISDEIITFKCSSDFSLVASSMEDIIISIHTMFRLMKIFKRSAIEFSNNQKWIILDSKFTDFTQLEELLVKGTPTGYQACLACKGEYTLHEENAYGVKSVSIASSHGMRLHLKLMSV